MIAHATAQTDSPSLPGYCGRRAQCLLLLLCLCLLIPFARAQVPEREGRVRDDAGLWQKDRVQAWEQRLENYFHSTGNEVALLTVSGLQGRDIDSFGREVFTAWDLDEARHAALLIVAMEESLARVQVSRHSRDVLPEQLRVQILRDMVVPALQRNPAKGLEVGLEALKEALSARMSYTPSALPWGNYARILLSVILLSAALFLLGARARQLSLPFALLSVAGLTLALLYQLMGLALLGAVAAAALVVWSFRAWRLRRMSGRSSGGWPDTSRRSGGGLSASLGARARQANRHLRR